MKYQKPNKTEQIAKFLLLSAKPMSARQMYDAGFRFDVGDTTPTAINVLLGKMHVSSRYDLQRSREFIDGRSAAMVHVLAIDGGECQDAEPVMTERGMWHMLLSRKPTRLTA